MKLCFNFRFVKIRINTRCFVVVGVNAFCGFVCWIEAPSAVSGKLKPPHSFYVVLLMVFFLMALSFLMFFNGVLELPLVLFLSLGAISSELNPTPSFFIVLLMVLFLVALTFLVLFFMFLSLPWCCSFPLVLLLVNRPPLLFYCVVDGFLHGGLKFPVFFFMFLNLPWCYSFPLVPFLTNQTPPFPSLLP